MIANYFETINNYRKAYYFGLLYSDGNIYKRKDRPNSIRIQLKLHQDDKYIIEKFKNDIQCHINIRDEKDGSRLIFSSSQMGDDLINNGCIPNKSLIKKFPIIDSSLVWHFIRGYFDGNGFAHKPKWGMYIGIVTGSKDFYHGLCNLLQENNISFSVQEKRPDNTNIISIGSKEEREKFVNLIYRDCNDLFLIRKFEKIAEYVNTEVINEIKKSLTP